MTDPHSEIAARRNWLCEHARLGRVTIEEIAVIAGKSPDPQFQALCQKVCQYILVDGLTATMLAGGEVPAMTGDDTEAGIRGLARSLGAAIPRIASTPAAPPAPPGWWGRLRLAWRVLFPGQ